MPNCTAPEFDWLAKLRDCWHREQRTMSKLIGGDAPGGWGAPLGCGWGVIGTAGELICGVGFIEELAGRGWEKEETGGEREREG